MENFPSFLLLLSQWVVLSSPLTSSHVATYAELGVATDSFEPIETLTDIKTQTVCAARCRQGDTGNSAVVGCKAYV